MVVLVHQVNGRFRDVKRLRCSRRPLAPGCGSALGLVAATAIGAVPTSVMARPPRRRQSERHRSGWRPAVLARPITVVAARRPAPAGWLTIPLTGSVTGTLVRARYPAQINTRLRGSCCWGRCRPLRGNRGPAIRPQSARHRTVRRHRRVEGELWERRQQEPPDHAIAATEKRFTAHP